MGMRRIADALTRSWKQIIKFRSSTSPASAGEVARSAGEGARSAGGGASRAEEGSSSSVAAPRHGIGGFIAVTPPAKVSPPRKEPDPTEPLYAGEGSKELPRRVMHPKRKTIGLRIPDHPVALDFLAELGETLLTTTLQLPGDESEVHQGRHERKPRGAVPLGRIDRGVQPHAITHRDHDLGPAAHLA